MPYIFFGRVGKVQVLACEYEKVAVSDLTLVSPVGVVHGFVCMWIPGGRSSGITIEVSVCCGVSVVVCFVVEIIRYYVIWFGGFWFARVALDTLTLLVDAIGGL